MLSAPDFDKKKILIVQLSRGERLSFKNDNIIIRTEEKTIRHQSSCYRLFTLFIVGHLTITTGLLQRAKRFGFSIYLLTHGMRVYGSFNSGAQGNVLLRQKQYQYNATDIAQYLVSQKINAQLQQLKKRRDKSNELKQSIEQLKNYRARFYDNHLNVQDILGIEGIASKVYFSAMFDNIHWQGRKPRVKHDICNVLLDIGYTQLFNIVDSLLNLYGFDVYQGVYHQVFYQRKSLVCDLVEPFRPIIDARIRKAFQLKQIHEEDFDKVGHQYRIFGKKAAPYTMMLMQEILDHKMLLFYFVQQYYRAFMQDKPIEHYPDVQVWYTKLKEKES